MRPNRVYRSVVGLRLNESAEHAGSTESEVCSCWGPGTSLPFCVFLWLLSIMNHKGMDLMGALFTGLDRILIRKNIKTTVLVNVSKCQP